MPPEISQIEEKRREVFNQARAQEKTENESLSENPPRKTLSFSDKISKYWPILAAAVFFDLLALIPFVSIIVNFLFGAFLFLYFYFGSKSKNKNKNALKSLFYILVPIILGSAIDWIFSLLPVNIFAALSRIALKEVE